MGAVSLYVITVRGWVIKIKLLLHNTALEKNVGIVNIVVLSFLFYLIFHFI